MGDADRCGWWRSHSVDDVAEYLLGEAFPHTWLAMGLELSVESARIRHDAALERSSAIHLFSDHLPFRQLLRSWLIERKLERDLAPLGWTRTADLDDLRRKVGPLSTGERRAQGLFLGTVTAAALESPGEQQRLLEVLSGAYANMRSEFVAPYVDVVE